MDSLSTIKINEKSFESMPNATETAIEDVEISIFDAEKYFNEELNDLKRAVEKKQPESHDPLSSPAEKSVRAATSSEASWNSQTALTAAARHRASKTWFAAKKWFLRRRRCCCDGESIRVKEVIGSDSDHIRPIVVMDSVKSSCNRNSKTVHAADHSYELQNDVVEIHRIRATEAAPGQQRILATGRPFINATVGFTFPILSSVAAAKDDDVGSDASSDLFEIEAFSTQTASSCPIQSLCDSVDGNSNGDRKSAAANGLHRSRLSVSASECRPTGGESEEAEGGEGRRKSDGGEGTPLIPLGACERPGPGSSRSPPLVAAGG
ncbi:protein PHYTOCHROME KINASE SUBSTRATE 4-like [Salvia hispanica]|uniref:protein PHYTOCHROME KINASE SUBSTRATE 4-like n=1 Tax=Salvia hispanica TaxID=49212 RepID=UPI002009C061|nr:protein PHYTOCHROME KINASE SUBSTRATE 4-like [Salvia hispanica]